MATKTISLEIEAYEKLRRAKRNGRESFSSVVRRASWNDLPPTAGQILSDLRSAMRARPDILLSDAELNGLARRQRTARRKTAWEKR